MLGIEHYTDGEGCSGNSESYRLTSDLERSNLLYVSDRKVLVSSVESSDILI